MPSRLDRGRWLLVIRGERRWNDRQKCGGHKDGHHWRYLAVHPVYNREKVTSGAKVHMDLLRATHGPVETRQTGTRWARYETGKEAKRGRDREPVAAG
jgi:hypothetical protein